MINHQVYLNLFPNILNFEVLKIYLLILFDFGEYEVLLALWVDFKEFELNLNLMINKLYFQKLKFHYQFILSNNYQEVALRIFYSNILCWKSHHSYLIIIYLPFIYNYLYISRF